MLYYMPLDTRDFSLSRLLIDTLLKQDSVVILDKFVKAYQEVCTHWNQSSTQKASFLHYLK